MPLPGWLANGLGIIENTMPWRSASACAASLNSIRLSALVSASACWKLTSYWPCASSWSIWNTSSPQALRPLVRVAPGRRSGAAGSSGRSEGLSRRSCASAGSAAALRLAAQQEELGLDAGVQGPAALGQARHLAAQHLARAGVEGFAGDEAVARRCARTPGIQGSGTRGAGRAAAVVLGARAHARQAGAGDRRAGKAGADRSAMRRRCASGTSLPLATPCMSVNWTQSACARLAASDASSRAFIVRAASSDVAQNVESPHRRRPAASSAGTGSASRWRRRRRSAGSGRA